MSEKIYFENSKGLRLCGVLSNPTLDTNSPLVILCHGLSTNKESSTYVRLEQMLNGEELSTFRFDFFGHGESEGEFENITISEAVDDIQSAIKFLKTKGFSKLGLVGASFGGMSSIIAASTSNDLFVLILKSPVSDYLEVEKLRKTPPEMEEWETKGVILHKNNKLNYSFVEDFENNNAYEAAQRIKIPTLIVHGDEDKTVPIQQSKKLTETIQNSTLEIVTGADHKYTNPKYFDHMLNLISNFILKKLQQDNTST